MAVAIERLTPAAPHYPWPLWMNGRAYRAESGVDFTCTVRGFLSSLYTRAERNDRTVETKVIDGRYVEFQFDEPPKAKPRKKPSRKARK